MKFLRLYNTEKSGAKYGDECDIVFGYADSNESS